MITRKMPSRIPKTKNKQETINACQAAADHPGAHFVNRENGGCFMEKPLVSVVMPAYNGEKYIGKAIESVLAQNVPVELLVIDDCSTDGTELAVMKYMDLSLIHI